jgi:hypothetical protein
MRFDQAAAIFIFDAQRGTAQLNEENTYCDEAQQAGTNEENVQDHGGVVGESGLWKPLEPSLPGQPALLVPCQIHLTQSHPTNDTSAAMSVFRSFRPHLCEN